jgi:ubiquinone/menaquinone biosynthesis C-methylase UbiE
MSDTPDTNAVRDVPTREGYDLWAASYDGDPNPLVALEEPLVDGLLGDVRGLDVLDLGCGTGRHTVRLARAGARVTAADFSDGMLAQAMAKPGAGGVRFLRADLHGRLPLGDGSFDRVLCALVLDHIAGVDGLFSEFARLARPDGAVVVTVMHPAVMLRGVQARFTDSVTGLQVRPRSVPNRVCDYVMAAARAGLVFDAMGEHTPDAALAERVPRAAKYVGWPLLVTMRLRRGG